MIKSIILNIYKSEFFKNFSSLFSLGIIAQVASFLAEPIISRLYTPEDFGVLALYISTISIFGIISTGRYELAVVLPKKDEDAVNIIVLGLQITLLIALISLIIFLFAGNRIYDFLNNDKISKYFIFIPISVLLTGMYQTFNYWSTRKKSFKTIGFSKIAQSTTNAVIAIILGLQKLGSSGLVIAYITGQFFSNIPVVWKFLSKNKYLIKAVSRYKIKEMAKEYSDFPKINSVHAFSDILQLSMVNFMISFFFTDTILGLYSKTFRVLTLPASIIGSSVGQVFFQKASSIYNQKGNLKNFVKKTMFGLSILALPIFIVIFAWGDEIFAFVLGDIWKTSGKYAQIISIWMYFKFIISPVSSIPIVVGKQLKIFYISLIGNLIIVVSIMIGGYLNNFIFGLYILVVAQIIYNIFLIRWIIKISGTTKS